MYEILMCILWISVIIAIIGGVQHITLLYNNKEEIDEYDYKELAKIASKPFISKNLKDIIIYKGSKEVITRKDYNDIITLYEREKRKNRFRKVIQETEDQYKF